METWFFIEIHNDDEKLEEEEEKEVVMVVEKKKRNHSCSDKLAKDTRLRCRHNHRSRDQSNLAINLVLKSNSILISLSVSKSSSLCHDDDSIQFHTRITDCNDHHHNHRGDYEWKEIWNMKWKEQIKVFVIIGKF